jgi:hypothetical protein
MNIIRLLEARDFDARYNKECYINVDEISSIQEQLVGERSSGSKITLNSANTIKVWENPERVYKLITKILQEKCNEN